MVLGFYQEWERERVDFVWYEDNRTKPSVAIEHENWHAEIKGSEVPKLLGHSAPLKVLVTYLYPSKDDAETKAAVLDILHEVEDVFQSAAIIPSGEFMVVIGGDLEKHGDWTGFLWRNDDRAWIQLE